MDPFTMYGLTTDGEIKVQQPEAVEPWVSDVTLTVGSGKDFSTIQAAFNYLSGNKYVGKAVVIDVDAGAYAENVNVDNVHNLSTSHLLLRGDTRNLAGVAFIDGAPINPGSLTYGGSGTCSVTSAGSTFTVTGSTTNPNFASDGWGNGDTIYASMNSGGVSGYTVQSVSGNTITCTTTVGTIGNDGTGIQLRPNRRISGSTTPFAISNFYMTAQGFHFMGPGLGTNQCVQVSNNAILALNHCCWTHSYYGVMASWGGQVSAPTSNSGFYNTQGCYAFNHGRIYLTYTRMLGHSLAGQYGYNSGRGGFIEAYGAAASLMTTHFNAGEHSFLYAIATYARGNGSGTGYQAGGNATLLAHATNLNHNVGTAYSPSGTWPGWATSTTHGVLYASNS